MLAREQWTKPSLADFTAWLETKPRDEEYDWIDGTRCACWQYAVSIGKEKEWRRRNWCRVEGTIWLSLDKLAFEGERTLEGKWTFGELLDRVKKFRKRRWSE